MTNDDTSTQESIAPDRAAPDHAKPDRVPPGQYVTAPAHLDGSWKRVGRKAVAQLLEDALDDLATETELAVDDVRRGETVTSDHVDVLRQVLDGLEFAVEAHLAALAEDREPWALSERPGIDAERRQFARVRCDCACHDHHDEFSVDAPRSAGVQHADGTEFD